MKQALLIFAFLFSFFCSYKVSAQAHSGYAQKSFTLDDLSKLYQAADTLGLSEYGKNAAFNIAAGAYNTPEEIGIVYPQNGYKRLSFCNKNGDTENAQSTEVFLDLEKFTRLQERASYFLYDTRLQAYEAGLSERFRVNETGKCLSASKVIYIKTSESIIYIAEAAAQSTYLSSIGAKAPEQEAYANFFQLTVNNGSGFTDETIIYFADSVFDAARPSEDVFKPFKPYRQKISLYTKDEMSGRAISLNARFLDDYSKEIPLGFTADENGIYTLSASDMRIDKKVSLRIEDTKTGSFHNFGVNASYAFRYEISDYPDRFVLHISAGMKKPKSVSEYDLISVYSAGKSIYVNTMADGKTEMWVYSLSGKMVHNSLINAPGMTKRRLSAPGGVYVVKISSEHGTFSKKVILR